MALSQSARALLVSVIVLQHCKLCTANKACAPQTRTALQVHASSLRSNLQKSCQRRTRAAMRRRASEQHCSALRCGRISSGLVHVVH